MCHIEFIDKQYLQADGRLNNMVTPSLCVLALAVACCVLFVQLVPGCLSGWLRANWRASTGTAGEFAVGGCLETQRMRAQTQPPAAHAQQGAPVTCASCVLPELSLPTPTLCSVCARGQHARWQCVLFLYDCSPTFRLFSLFVTVLSFYDCRMVEYVTPIANPEVIKALQIGG